MATASHDSEKEFLLNMILDELSRSIRSPALEYLNTDFEHSGNDMFLTVGVAAPQAQQDECLERLFRFDSQSKLLFNGPDENFCRLFKMRKQTMKDLICVLEKRLAISNDSGTIAVSVAKKVLMTCWLLTSGEDFSKAAEIFSLKVENVSTIFYDVCSEVTKLIGEYIKWPKVPESDHIIDAFETQFGFPGVLGVIGYCKFKINAPPLKQGMHTYYNPRSERHALVVQAVCDDKMIFHDVCIGFPAEGKPSDLLLKSSLYSHLVSRSAPLMKPETYILGSSEYPQLSNLLTPYSPEARGRPLDEMECKFNKSHSAACNVIDKCFRNINARFRRLRSECPSFSEATKVVLAACVIHNFAILRGDKFDSE